MQFDYIGAFASGGVTELDNIAPMCETHNKAKGALPLEDFRVKLRLNDFFSHGDAVTLKHLLAFMKKSGDIMGYGQGVVATEIEGDHSVRLDAGNAALHVRSLRLPHNRLEILLCNFAVALFDSDDDEDQKKRGYSHASSFLKKCLKCIGTFSVTRYCNLPSVV